MFRFIGRSGRRLGVTIAGGTLVLLGIVGIIAPVIPGPLLIIAGLAVLGTEYAWAKRALESTKRRAKQVANSVRRRRGTLPVEAPADPSIDPSINTAGGALAESADPPSPEGTGAIAPKNADDQEPPAGAITG